MHVGEYLLALVGIVLGLAVADLGISTHRLIRRRADVKFDVVPILAALIAAYLVFLNFWGDYWQLKDVQEASLWATLPNLVVLFLSFLIAASALPDEWEGKLDLWSFYVDNRVQFWVLVGLAGTAVNLYNMLNHWPPLISDLVGTAVTWGFTVAGCLSRRWWFSLLITGGFLALIVTLAGNPVIRG